MDTLLDSGRYSDLTLQCQEKTWKVHRAVLCTSSRVFAAMVDNDFKEGQSHKIDLPADEPEIVEKMLRFVYQKDYDDERDTDASNSNEPVSVDGEKEDYISHTSYPRPSPHSFMWGAPVEAPPTPSWSERALLVNVKVYIIADKNDIGALKKHAMEKYAEVVGHLWDTPSFPASAKLLYNNTPASDRLMRDVIAETAKKNILTLIDKEEFEEVMVSHGDLAVDVLKSVLLRGGKVDSEVEYGGRKNKKKVPKRFD